MKDNEYKIPSTVNHLNFTGDFTGEIMTYKAETSLPFKYIFITNSGGDSTLTFNPDGSATFEGNADEAAQVFFDNVIKKHNQQYHEYERRIAEQDRLLEEASEALRLNNVLAVRNEALVAENAYLLPKAASELSNSWVLHKYLIGIQAAIMYLDSGNKTAAQEWLYGTISGPGFEFPDEVEDIDAWANHQMRDSIGHERALEIIKAEIPATGAFLSKVRKQARNEGVNYAASRLAGAFNNGFVDKQLAEVADVVQMILDAKADMANNPNPPADGLSGEYARKSLEDWKEQLRGEASS